MTRLILVFVFGALFALVNVSRANPSPTPGVKVKRFTSHSVHNSGQTSAHTPTPTPGAHTVHTFGPGQVGSAPGNSMRTGNADTIPRPASSRVIMTPGGGSERVFMPNEYNEPDSPAAGPGFKSAGSPPGSLKIKSQSNVVASTATRKVAVKILIPQLAKNSNAASSENTTEADIDANPPTPGELGAPVVTCTRV